MIQYFEFISGKYEFAGRDRYVLCEWLLPLFIHSFGIRTENFWESGLKSHLFCCVWKELSKLNNFYVAKNFLLK